MIRYLEALWANRYTTSIVALLVLVAGYVAFTGLPRSVFPSVDFPRVSILVSDGYTPVHVMLVRITEPLEQAAKGVRNVTLVRSSTSTGLTKIHVYFNRAITPNDAFMLLEARIGQVRLPFGAHMTVRLMMPSMYPFAQYALVSQTHTSSALMPLYAFTVRPRLLDIAGVYQVTGIGRGWPQVRVALSARRLMQWHVGLGSVVRLLENHQGPYFGGLAQTLGSQFLVTAAGRPATVASLKQLLVPLADKPGLALPLQALAHIAIVPPPRTRGAAVAHWRHSLVINIAAQAHANVEAVAAHVRRVIAALRTALPTGVHLVRTYHFAHLIRSSLDDVWAALLLGTLVTFGVLLVFLRRFDTAAATLIVVPLSLAGTMLVLHVMGLGLNIMTLGGLTAAIGALIDHAIVVVEQAHHIPKGLRPEERQRQALAAMSAVLPTMTFATMTSALVFVPLIFLHGTIGILFREMAIALVSALVISQVVALTVTPLLALALTARRADAPQAWRMARVGRVVYAQTLRRVLHKPRRVFPVVLILFAATFLIFRQLPTAFLPSWNEGIIAVPFRTSVDDSVADTLRVGRGLMRIASHDPDVRTTSLIVGESLGNPRATANKGDLVLTLAPTASTDAVIRVLGRRLRAAYPSLTMLKLHQILITELGNLSGAHSPLDVDLFGHSPTSLAAWGHTLAVALRATHMFRNVSFPAAAGGPAVTFTPRAQAITAGVTPPRLGEQLAASFWGVPAGFLLRGAQILPIAVTVTRPFARQGRPVPNIFVRTPGGLTAPLSALARSQVRPSVPFIAHENLVPYVDIQVHPRADMGLTQAAIQVQKIVTRLRLPNGITARIGGYYKEQSKSFLQMEWTLIFALLVLLVLVGYQLGGQRPALAVLLATSVSALGALAALALWGIPLDSTSFLGTLLVFAIVVNNGILIFGQARHYRAPPGRLEVELAARRRLRPILMTMVADVLGFLPLAMGIGHGTDLLKPLATAVMGGLTIAIFASLFVGPLLYVAFLRAPTRSRFGP